MKAAIYLLARRYLWDSLKEHTLWIMLLISFFSIAIGSFSLSLVTAIMNGFEQAIHYKLQTINPAATLYANDPIALTAIEKLITQEFPEVTALSPYGIHHIIICPETMADDAELENVALLRAINPAKEQKVTQLGQKIIAGSSLDTALNNNQIMIGKTMADDYAIKIGDHVTLYYIESSGNKKAVTSTQATISAIFQTGIDEYDATMVYSSEIFFDKIFPDAGITQIGLSFVPGTIIDPLIKQLEQRTGFEVKSWQQLYPALVSALTLEKYAMFFILALISLVASMNIIALIFMLIAYKKADIALLKAFGMSTRDIQRFFISIGMSISLAATLIGISLAWIVAFLLEQYPFIALPDTYYVSYLPCTMTLAIGLSVLLLTSLITFGACWSATRAIRSINIAQLLRFEG